MLKIDHLWLSIVILLLLIQRSNGKDGEIDTDSDSKDTRVRAVDVSSFVPIMTSELQKLVISTRPHPTPSTFDNRKITKLLNFKSPTPTRTSNDTNSDSKDAGMRAVDVSSFVPIMTSQPQTVAISTRPHSTPSTFDDNKITKLFNFKPPMPTRTSNGTSPTRTTTSNTLSSPSFNDTDVGSDSDMNPDQALSEYLLDSNSPKIISCSNKTVKGSLKEYPQRFKPGLNVPLLVEIIDELTNDYDNEKFLRGLNKSLLKLRKSKLICQEPFGESMYSDAKTISSDDIIIVALLVYNCL